MDKLRCLLIHSGLPKTFWTEATCTAAYLINRSPSTSIEKKTPMEMWSGHPSDYRMLRIFSCVAYPYDKQGKLDPRPIKCVLLGYPEGVNGYRLYRLDDESPKIVTSRNVVFNESDMYKDTLKDSVACVDKHVEELQVEVKMDDPNITMEEYIRLEEEKAHRRAIVFNDTLTSEASLSCEPMISSLNNDEIDFRISFDESDDEDCMDNDDDKIDIEHSSRDLSVKQLPDLINTDVGAYAHGTVYTTYSLNEYNVYRYQYGVSWGMDTAYQFPV
ncbi:retrovirus-related pol polyprotein from transposon TNT 1-94 [Tanacetum coccineum]